ncbi:MAG TPA: M23 family metallopeptidase [Bacillales bacterium]|nr:M23 family metallopeptidase [Bacillales bacterium]
MANRADEIRRRHEERKKRRLFDHKNERPAMFHETGKDPDSLSAYQKYSGSGEKPDAGHPLIRKEWVVLRVMIAVVLFLIVGILFKNPAPVLDQARGFVKETFSNEFQFAMVSDWYQEQFGEPLALLPTTGQSNNEMKAGKTKKPEYVVPVSGTVKETFADTGKKGIMLQTVSDATVSAVKQGFVTYVGTDKGLGKTVIVELSDGGVAWYGKLDKVSVRMYDYVDKGQKIGTVTPSGDGDSGTFFFALKKDNAFINPLKVIHFE